MITVREIEEKSMSPEKRKYAKRDFFSFYIGRPISYVLTIPFLYTNISPNTVSYLSFIPSIFGFILLAAGQTRFVLLLGWFCFFIWNMLDGIDGNIARYKKQFSEMGDTLDAAAGYFAMVLTYFGAGVAAFHDGGILEKFISVPPEVYIILGGLSSLSAVMPRLIMHKMITSIGKSNISDIRKSESYGFVRIAALNITSVSGFVQILLLVSILLHTLDLYTICYFGINILVMLVSFKIMFKD